MANSINVSLSLRTQAFIKDLNQTERRLQRAARNMSNIGTQLSVGVSVPLAAAGASILQTAANFEKSMNGVLAVTSGAGEAFAELEAKAKELGATTQFSATEAAQAIEMLGRNGLTAAQILGGAADASLMLAAATGTDLANAANIATDAMMQFGLEAGDLSRVADLIAGSTSNSKFSIDDFQYALANAGGVAGVAGVAFDDFATTIAAISPAFASGQDAGTSLKTFMTSLVPSTKPATEAMRKLGIITADGANRFLDASGSLRSMEEIVGILNSSFAGLTDSQRVQAAQTIFGTDAMRAALAMANMTSDGFAELSTRIGDVSAAEQAEIRMRGFEGAMKRLQSAFETLQLAIASSGLLEFATQFVEGLTNMMLRMSELNPAILSMATGLGGVLAVMGPAAFAISQFYNMQLLAIGGIKNMVMSLARLANVTKLMTSMQAALNVITAANPYVLAAAAVAALGAALYVLYQRSEAFRRIVDSLTQAVGVVLRGAFEVFRGAVQAVGIVVKALFQALGRVYGEVLRLVGAVVKMAATWLIGEKNIAAIGKRLAEFQKLVVVGFKNIPALAAGVKAVLLQLAQNVATAFQRIANELQILVLRGRKAITLNTDARAQIQSQIDAIRAETNNMRNAGTSLGEAFRTGFRSQAFLDSGAMNVPTQSVGVGAVEGVATAVPDVASSDLSVSDLSNQASAIQKVASAKMNDAQMTALQSKTLGESIAPLQNYASHLQGATVAQVNNITRTQELAAALGSFNESMNTIVTDGLTNLIQGFGDLGGQLAAGSISIKQFASGIFETLINVISQLGDLAIKVGVGVLGIQTALKSLNPVAAIAAGVALKAFASFAKSKLADLATPFADGGIVMPRPGGIFANIGEAGRAEAVIPLDRLPSLLAGGQRTQRREQLVAQVRGRDLQFVLQEYLNDRARFA